MTPEVCTLLFGRCGGGGAGATMNVLPPAPDHLTSLPFASTDMDVDTEDGFALDIHDAPQEKMDADFFNAFEDDFDDEDIA